MEGLKFCSATVFQFLLLLIMFFTFGRIKYRMRRAIFEASGVTSRTRHSVATIVIFAFFMFSFMWTMDEVSTLVLNSNTIAILALTIVTLIILSFSISKRIQSELQPFMLPHERLKEISILLVLGGCLVSVNLMIETSFRWQVVSSPIEAQIQTVKPTRGGSPIYSLKVAIPAHELNNEKNGFSFLRFDTRKTSDRFATGQSLQLVLQKGSLGLNRALAKPEQSYLKNRLFF